MTKKIHYFAGITIALFVGVHLFNHVLILFGEDVHLSFMENARVIYRNPIIESILLLAVFIQIVSGIRLVRQNWKSLGNIYCKLHIYSGLYLSFFLVAHTSAVLIGRFYLKLDTNLYFGAAPLNSMPFPFFFIPYYGLAISSFFTHIACIHQVKIRQFNTNSKQANIQANFIIGLGLALSVIIIWKMIGIKIPTEYLKHYR